MSSALGSSSLPTVGFVILSHREGPELRTLIDVLNHQYDRPRIVVHHDFGQAPLNEREFPDVCFVRPSRTTGWGKWGVVEGALDALALLYGKIGPDWFFLLSTVDYPVMDGREVRSRLAEANCDAFIDIRPLQADTQAAAALTGSSNRKLNHFASQGNVAIKRRFYLSNEYWIPVLRFRPRFRIGRITYRPPREGAHPFRDGFACFYGDHWFHANRRAAEALLIDDERMRRLKKHCRRRTQVDEAFFATVLANSPELTLCLDNKRFAEWNGGGAHPALLTEDHAAEALSSGAFFARKISHEGGCREAIDNALRTRC